MKAKAAILTELNTPLAIEDLEIPKLSKHQVLVQIKASAICGSQIGEIQGHKGSDPWLPHCLGHEASGVIQDMGPGVRHLKPGQRVVLHWKPGEGQNSKTPLYGWGNKTVNAGWVTTFQEYAVVSENRVTAFDAPIEDPIASLYGCCMTTGFGVIEKDAQLKEGESVLVLGAGGVGLISILAAKHHKASHIIAVDIHDSKLALAKEYGATHMINSKTESLVDRIQEIMGKRVLDIVLENTGIKQLIEMGYALCGPKGRTILVGVPQCHETASINTLPLHFGKVFTGSHGGNAEPQHDIARLMNLQVHENWKLNKMIDKTYALDDINDALTDFVEGRVIRPMLHMDLS